MAYFARINSSGVVRQVIAVMDCMTGSCIGSSNPYYALNPKQHINCGTAVYPATEMIGQTFLASIGMSGIWKQTSYDNSFRGNFAGDGMKYDSTRDAFIAPKNFNSWILNEVTCQWKAPTPMPTDGKMYSWDEPTLTWKAN